MDIPFGLPAALRCVYGVPEVVLTVFVRLDVGPFEVALASSRACEGIGVRSEAVVKNWRDLFSQRTRLPA